MSYQIGTATGYDDLLNKLDTFLTSQGMTTSPLYAGTGNGTIGGLIGGSASIAENITVTMSSSTAFSVTGSTSGSLGSGTVGTAFTSSKVNFTITAGATAFVSGDNWTFSTTPVWTSQRRTSGAEMIWQAPGNGGLDQIFVGASAFSNVPADYYNWRLGGFIAYNAALPFNQQAGYVGGNNQSRPSPVLNLWNSSTPYWFVANGRRVIVVAKVSTVYVIGYLGFLNQYVSPQTFPYPLVVGGSMCWQSEPALTSANWRWSYSAGQEMNNPTHCWNTAINVDAAGQTQMRLPSGLWHSFYRPGDTTNSPGGKIWPGNMFPASIATNLDGSYTMFPIVLGDTGSTNPQNMWGELDGLLWITGYQNGSENTITIGSSIYLVVQNVFRVTSQDYAAVKLI